ncbi:hypothetical protein ACTQ3L_03940 [Oscillospiraceae bacterium LCP25S3_E4]
MINALTAFNILINELKINYHYGCNNDAKITYPYWVGEALYTSQTYEDKSENITIKLVGISRGSYTELLREYDRIKNYFKHTRKLHFDSGVAVFNLAGTTPYIPTGDADLKRTEINIDGTLWETD